MRSNIVFIVFRKPMCTTDLAMQRAFCLGTYIHSEIYVPYLEWGTSVGISFTNFSGDVMQARDDMKISYKNDPSWYCCFELYLDDDEYSALISQNAALVQRHVKYNYMDCTLLILPNILRNAFVHDTEIQKLGPGYSKTCTAGAVDELSHIRRLFCSQSIILTLRVALRQDHVLYSTIHNHIARSTSPNELFEAMRNVLGPPFPISRALLSTPKFPRT
jgi:hypothetical protein